MSELGESIYVSFGGEATMSVLGFSGRETGCVSMVGVASDFSLFLSLRSSLSLALRLAYSVSHFGLKARTSCIGSS